MCFKLLFSLKSHQQNATLAPSSFMRGKLKDSKKGSRSGLRFKDAKDATKNGMLMPYLFLTPYPISRSFVQAGWHKARRKLSQGASKVVGRISFVFDIIEYPFTVLRR